MRRKVFLYLDQPPTPEHEYMHLVAVVVIVHTFRRREVNLKPKDEQQCACDSRDADAAPNFRIPASLVSPGLE